MLEESVEEKQLIFKELELIEQELIALKLIVIKIEKVFSPVLSKKPPESERDVFKENSDNSEISNKLCSNTESINSIRSYLIDIINRSEV